MATVQDGGRKRATTNTTKAMRRSAQRRQCPNCGRKSAMVTTVDDWAAVRACRWCDHTEVTELDPRHE